MLLPLMMASWAGQLPLYRCVNQSLQSPIDVPCISRYPLAQHYFQHIVCLWLAWAKSNFCALQRQRFFVWFWSG